MDCSTMDHFTKRPRHKDALACGCRPTRELKGSFCDTLVAPQSSCCIRPKPYEDGQTPTDLYTRTIITWVNTRTGINQALWSEWDLLPDTLIASECVGWQRWSPGEEHVNEIGPDRPCEPHMWCSFLRPGDRDNLSTSSVRGVSPRWLHDTSHPQPPTRGPFLWALTKSLVTTSIN